jgi:hypothetical protein
MPFIGNQPALSYTSFAKQDFTTSATTSYTLDNPVANANELALFINFVRQEPTAAYSASGTTLTLTSATSATDDMYCVYLGQALQTVNPANASVGAAQLASDAVTTAKILDANVTAAKLGTDAKNTPAFNVYLASDQSITNDTFNKVTFDTEVYDSGSVFASNKFTPAVVGKYLLNAGVFLDSGLASNLNISRVALYKNGSLFKEVQWRNDSNQPRRQNPTFSHLVDVTSITDYFEVYAYLQATSTATGLTVNGGAAYTYFNGYKIIE